MEDEPVPSEEEEIPLVVEGHDLSSAKLRNGREERAE